MSLVARHLEANGIPTIILGSALDIVEYCGVPRFLFTDFPLGNPCGVPYDRSMQRTIVESALSLLETASGPRTTLRSSEVFSDSSSDSSSNRMAWQESYLAVSDDNRAELAASGAARRALLARQKSGA